MINVNLIINAFKMKTFNFFSIFGIINDQFNYKPLLKKREILCCRQIKLWHL